MILNFSAYRVWSSWCGDLGTCRVQWLHEVIKPWLLHSQLRSDRCWSYCCHHWFHWLLWSSQRTYVPAENSKRLCIYFVVNCFIWSKQIFRTGGWQDCTFVQLYLLHPKTIHRNNLLWMEVENLGHKVKLVQILLFNSL